MDKKLKAEIKDIKFRTRELYKADILDKTPGLPGKVLRLINRPPTWRGFAIAAAVGAGLVGGMALLFVFAPAAVATVGGIAALTCAGTGALAEVTNAFGLEYMINKAQNNDAKSGELFTKYKNIFVDPLLHGMSSQKEELTAKSQKLAGLAEAAKAEFSNAAEGKKPKAAVVAALSKLNFLKHANTPA